MLILARNEGEEIIITAPDGTRLVVVPVRIDPGRVRIGVTAPREWAVNRAELQRAIDRERAAVGREGVGT